MGIFDFLHYKERNDTLEDAVSKFKQAQTPSNLISLANCLKKYVDNNSWVHIPGKNDIGGFKLEIFEENKKSYAAIFTSEKTAKQSQKDIVFTDINKLIDVIFQNAELAGIVINPCSTNLYLEKHGLLRLLFHDVHGQSNVNSAPQKNWGNGIPQFSNRDIMPYDEMLDFAIEVILNNDEDLHKQYRILSVCNNVAANFHLLLSNYKGLNIVYVKAGCALEDNSLTNEERAELLEISKKYNVECHVAIVEFGSVDPDRFAAKLLLRGDGFHAKYTGIEVVE